MGQRVSGLSTRAAPATVYPDKLMKSLGALIPNQGAVATVVNLLRTRSGIVVMACVMFIAACGTTDRQLPSTPDWRGNCATGVGRDAVLHGSLSDPRVNWAVDRVTGRRIELLWPVGYSARFAPALEIMDEKGGVVGSEGDYIVGSCLVNPADGGAIRVNGEDVSKQPL